MPAFFFLTLSAQPQPHPCCGYVEKEIWDYGDGTVVTFNVKPDPFPPSHDYYQLGTYVITRSIFYTNPDCNQVIREEVTLTCRCATTADCDDGNWCTNDVCIRGSCQNRWKCVLNDQNPCTVDYCDSTLKSCVHVQRDCNDYIGCTNDYCAGGVCLHNNFCPDDGDTCTLETCRSNTCRRVTNLWCLRFRSGRSLNHSLNDDDDIRIYDLAGRPGFHGPGVYLISNQEQTVKMFLK